MKDTRGRIVVIKIGSSLFCKGNAIDLKVFQVIAGQVLELIKAGYQPVIVSSGAIALGMHALKFSDRPKEVHQLQACAAVGQNELMNAYRNFFRTRKVTVGQVLLTWEDFRSRERYLNAKNTLHTLLAMRAVPVINENDTVSTDEIRVGDNDRLSALVATLVDARLLIILSDVAGLLEKDLKTVIPVVERITPEIKALACPTTKKTCVGGMVTKIEAARIAIESGIPCVIAHGRAKGIIVKAVREPLSAGTLFLPKKGLAERDRWIAFASRPVGKVEVDEGAKKAVLGGKSLLAVGIACIHGEFKAGDIVSIVDASQREFARGIVSAAAKELELVRGLRHEREALHCDNIVLVEGTGK